VCKSPRETNPKGLVKRNASTRMKYHQDFVDKEVPILVFSYIPISPRLSGFGRPNCTRRIGGKFVVSRAGEAYDARDR